MLWPRLVVVTLAVLDEVEPGTVPRAAVPKLEADPAEVVDVEEAPEVVVVPEACPWPPLQAPARTMTEATANIRALMLALRSWQRIPTG